LATTSSPTISPRPRRLVRGDDQRGALARLLMDFIKNTDPAEFEFSEEDLGLLRERMLARPKRSR
jgi:hypothetical protein